MALSGFTEDKNALWRRTCGTLRYQLENPYLRAIFAFLACDEDNYEDVLVGLFYLIISTRSSESV